VYEGETALVTNGVLEVTERNAIPVHSGSMPITTLYLSRKTAIHPTRQLVALNFATIAVMSSCCS
jgi:hypothetical protein